MNIPIRDNQWKNMSIFDFDIDKQIKQYQQNPRIRRPTPTHAQKIEGIKEFGDAITRICNQNNLTEEELYVSRSEQIEQWILGMSRQSNPSLFIKTC